MYRDGLDECIFFFFFWGGAIFLGFSFGDAMSQVESRLSITPCDAKTLFFFSCSPFFSQLQGETINDM